MGRPGNPGYDADHARQYSHTGRMGGPARPLISQEWRVWVEVECQIRYGDGREDYNTHQPECVGTFDNEADAQALAASLEDRARPVDPLWRCR